MERTCRCGHGPDAHNRFWDIDDGNGQTDTGFACSQCDCEDWDPEMEEWDG